MHNPQASGATVTTIGRQQIHLLPSPNLYIAVLQGASGSTPPPQTADSITYADGNPWVVVEVVASSQRSAQSPPPGGQQAYATEDLPPLPQVDQVLAVERVDLLANGRSQAHKSVGVEVIFVLHGKLEVHSGTFAPRQLSAGQGAFVLDNTPLQTWSLGGQAATSLDVHLLPAGKAFSTPLQISP